MLSVANQQCLRRTSNVDAHREAHPRAVLSTKKKNDDSTAVRGCSSPSDITPVDPTARVLSAKMVASPHCRVSRQPSTPVDLPPSQENLSPNARADGEYSVPNQLRPCSSRPATLGLKRDLSNSSNGSAATPCPVTLNSPDRQLGASYPPGPGATVGAQCYQVPHPGDEESYSVSS